MLAFGLVYFFWGSTYLAIDIAVERVPPRPDVCGVRFLIAGGFMLAFCALRGRNVLCDSRQLGRWRSSAWAVSHALLRRDVRGVGLAALIVAVRRSGSWCSTRCCSAIIMFRSGQKLGSALRG